MISYLRLLTAQLRCKATAPSSSGREQSQAWHGHGCLCQCLRPSHGGTRPSAPLLEHGHPLRPLQAPGLPLGSPLPQLLSLPATGLDAASKSQCCQIPPGAAGIPAAPGHPRLPAAPPGQRASAGDCCWLMHAVAFSAAWEGASFLMRAPWPWSDRLAGRCRAAVPCAPVSPSSHLRRLLEGFGTTCS